MKRSFSIIIALFLLIPAMAMAQPKGPAGPKTAPTPPVAGHKGPGMGPGMGHGMGPGMGHGMGKGGRHGGGNPFLMGHLDKIKVHLGLSDKQVTDIQTLQIKYMRLMLDLKKQMAVVKFDLKALVFDPAIDPVKAKALFAKEANLQAEKKMLRLQFLLEAEKLLTADQKKLARLMFIQHMHQGRGQ